MRTLVVGGGRLGRALALRAHSQGHETQIAVRMAKGESDAFLPGAVPTILIDAARSDYDAIVIAAPANRDPEREDLITSLLHAQTQTPLVFSAVAYPGAPHAAWSMGRRYLRFLCNPAVADPDHAALVIAEAPDGEVEQAFADWIGPARIEFTDAAGFERLGGLFMATVVHLETVRAFQSTFGTADDGASSRVAAGTLAEAAALLTLYEHDADAALNACQTPGGLTGRLRRGVRDSLERAAGLD